MRLPSSAASPPGMPYRLLKLTKATPTKPSLTTQEPPRHSRRCREGVELAGGPGCRSPRPAAEGVGVDGEVAGAGRDLEGAVRPVVDGGEAAAGLDRMPFGGITSGMRWLTGVDDAADRLRAVAQRRGAAHHLDPIGREGSIGTAWSSLRADTSPVADAVLLDAHAEAAQAADDGAAGAGRERRAGDAGPGRERIAERRGGLARQLLRRHHRDRHERLIGGNLQRRPAMSGAAGPAIAARSTVPARQRRPAA